MEPFEARLLAAELRTDLPTLDLHGLYPDEALDKIDNFLYTAAGQDGAVRIIYGGGTGVLAKAVLSYLQGHKLIATIRDLGGSCICLFN